ncbi:hypothetical protein A2U01_0102944, partial [Trifolium medium]|nr:hypothetical protein [Trifolium medium]
HNVNRAARIDENSANLKVGHVALPGSGEECWHWLILRGAPRDRMKEARICTLPCRGWRSYSKTRL